MIDLLTAERDAAVARAERAEEALRGMYSEVAMDCQYVAGLMAGWNAAQSDNPEEKYQSIMAAYKDRMKGETKASAIAAAPDKPQYAALSPEPWGGPEGEQ